MKQDRSQKEESLSQQAATSSSAISILQHENLFAITTVLKGTIPVTCSLPKNYTYHRVVIRQVLTGDTNEEISLALTKNGYKIRQVQRFSILKGIVKSRSTTVALEFEVFPPK